MSKLWFACYWSVNRDGGLYFASPHFTLSTSTLLPHVVMRHPYTSAGIQTPLWRKTGATRHCHSFNLVLNFFVHDVDINSSAHWLDTIFADHIHVWSSFAWHAMIGYRFRKSTKHIPPSQCQQATYIVRTTETLYIAPQPLIWMWSLRFG